MMEKFTELDQFSKYFNLQFNKKVQYQTSIGAFLTLFLILFGLSLFISQGMEFVYREQPITSIITKFDLNTELLYINRSSLLVAFQVVDKNFIPINDPTIFTMNSHLFINNNTSPTPFRQEKLELEPCSNAYSDFEKLNLTSYYNSKRMNESTFCMKEGTKIIGGEFNTAFFSNIWFQLKFCKNATGQPICKPKIQIEESLRGGYFEFFYIDSLYVASSFTNPLKKIMKNYFVKLDPKMEKMTEMYFKKLQVISDGGAVLIEDWHLNEDFTFDFITEEYQIMTDDGDTFFAFTINSSYNTMEISRRYLDLISFAGDMGGILNLFYLLFSSINEIFIKYKMLEDIFNSLYEFRLEDENPEVEKGLSVLEKFNALLPPTNKTSYDIFRSLGARTKYERRKGICVFRQAPDKDKLEKELKKTNVVNNVNRDFIENYVPGPIVPKLDIKKALNQDSKLNELYSQKSMISQSQYSDNNNIGNAAYNLLSRSQFENINENNDYSNLNSIPDNLENDTSHANFSPQSSINPNFASSLHKSTKSKYKGKRSIYSGISGMESYIKIDDRGSEKKSTTELSQIPTYKKAHFEETDKAKQQTITKVGPKNLQIIYSNNTVTNKSDNKISLNDNSNEGNEANDINSESSSNDDSISNDNNFTKPITRINKDDVKDNGKDNKDIKDDNDVKYDIINNENQDNIINNIDIESETNRESKGLLSKFEQPELQELLKLPEKPKQEKQSNSHFSPKGSELFKQLRTSFTTKKSKSSLELDKESRSSNKTLITNNAYNSNKNINNFDKLYRQTSQFAPKPSKFNHTDNKINIVPTIKKSSKTKTEFTKYEDSILNIETDKGLIQKMERKEGKKHTNKLNEKPSIEENENDTKNKLTRTFLISKLEEFKKQEKKMLSLSYLDIVGMVCCRSCVSKYKKKYDIIHKTEIESSKYLDYLDIIKLLQEFTKLKVFFMNLSQIKLFSYVSNPKISEQEKDEQTLKNNLINGKMFENTQDLNELYNHYLILKKSNKTKDQKLFNLLDDDIVQCFESMRELKL